MRGFVLFALCMIACTAAFARDLVVGDVLGLQSYGQTVLVAKQRLLLIERRRPYDQAPDFGYDTYFNGRVLTRILSVPLDRPDAPKPLFPQSDHAGYWIGSLSPSETRLTVFRLENRHLSLVDASRSLARRGARSADRCARAGMDWRDTFCLRRDVTPSPPRQPPCRNRGHAGFAGPLDATGQRRGDEDTPHDRRWRGP
jgi:hypothetical protein